MSNAKEMFKKLGFNQTKDGENIVYSTDRGFKLIFYHNSYTIKCGFEYFISNGIHKAINQQVKELGWE